MDDLEFRSFLRLAVEELTVKQAALQTEYGLGQYPRWWFDQASATLKFYDQHERVGLIADIINIGSFSTSASTWQWAWSNPSVLPALRLRAERHKELQATTGFGIFGRAEPFKADEARAWELSAMAVMHLGAVGCYRAPFTEQNIQIFLALETVHRLG